MRPSLASKRSAGAERAHWNPLTLALLASLWIASVANWPLWRAMASLPEMASPRGVVFMIGFGVMVAALTLAPLALLAWRWSVKPAIALFLIAAALGAHFMGTYGVVIDNTMMTNVLHTNAHEAGDLLSVRLLASLLLLAVLPLAWLWRVPLQRRSAPAQLARNLGTVAAALGVVVTIGFAQFAALSSTMREHRSLHYLINPLNSFYALGVVAHKAVAHPAGKLLPVGADAHLAGAGVDASKPKLMLLVVGETARADHFSLNGYARTTNAELSSLGVVSFTAVSSCGTSTETSLPCMFSHLGKHAFEARNAEHENLLDVARHAGLAVLWLDNQAGCKGLCARVPHADAAQLPAASAARRTELCGSGECLDEALLEGLDTRLAALDAERRRHGVLLVLHQMGSHGPAYYKRSPADRKPFLPECTTNVLQQCEPQQLVNAYDNSIAYTDHVLAQAIAWLQRQTPLYEPGLLYVSDHGESLGEHNLYLHGLPYALAPREQTHVPLVLWQPAGADVDGGKMLACLSGLRDKPLSHDYLFHSVLGWLGVATSAYRPALDLYAACRTAA